MAMALAGAGSANQHGVALGGEKAALVQLAHQPLVDRRHREVKLREVLHHREARHPHAVGDRAGAMIGQLGEQQLTEDALEVNGFLVGDSGRTSLLTVTTPTTLRKKCTTCSGRDRPLR